MLLALTEFLEDLCQELGAEINYIFLVMSEVTSGSGAEVLDVYTRLPHGSQVLEESE